MLAKDNMIQGLCYGGIVGVLKLCCSLSEHTAKVTGLVAELYELVGGEVEYEDVEDQVEDQKGLGAEEPDGPGF